MLSIDPNNNRIELSLKGKDVGDKDPAPKPERREKKSTSGKRQHSENNDGELSQSDDEGEKILKKLRKGLFNLCSVFEEWMSGMGYPPVVLKIPKNCSTFKKPMLVLYRQWR